MAEVINLNKVRKNKAKQERSAKAAENRVTFGTSSHVRKAHKLATERQQAALDGKHLSGAKTTKTIDDE